MSASFAGTLEVRARWEPASVLPLALELGVGADALTKQPSFSYETTAGVVRWPFWFVEPRIRLPRDDR